MSIKWLKPHFLKGNAIRNSISNIVKRGSHPVHRNKLYSKNRRNIADFVLFPASACGTFVQLSAEAEKFHLTFSTSTGVSTKWLKPHLLKENAIRNSISNIVKRGSHPVHRNKSDSKNRRNIADFVLFPASACGTFVQLGAETEKFHLTFSTSASV